MTLARRILDLFRALMGAGLSRSETDNAEAMLDLERQRLQQRLAQFNRGLAGHAAVSERLKAQLARLDDERALLLPRLELRLQLGDRPSAGRHALRLEAITSERAQLTTQVAETEAMYADLVRARERALQSARERIEALKRSIGQLRVQEALAGLTELAAGMQGALGTSDGSLARIQQQVEDRRDQAAGRVRVARDCAQLQDGLLLEREQQLLATQALARFEATARPGICVELPALKAPDSL